MNVPQYKRIVLKLSGEALAGNKPYGLEHSVLSYIAKQIAQIQEMQVQTAIVVGGGNIWRGVSGSAKGMDRVTADHMGMLATVINGLALQDALESENVPTRVMSAIEMREVAEPFIREQGPLLRMGGIRFSGGYLRRRRNEAISKRASPGVSRKARIASAPLLSLLVRGLGFGVGLGSGDG